MCAWGGDFAEKAGARRQRQEHVSGASHRPLSVGTLWKKPAGRRLCLGFGTGANPRGGDINVGSQQSIAHDEYPNRAIVLATRSRSVL